MHDVQVERGDRSPSEHRRDAPTTMNDTSCCARVVSVSLTLACGRFTCELGDAIEERLQHVQALLGGERQHPADQRDVDAIIEVLATVTRTLGAVRTSSCAGFGRSMATTTIPSWRSPCQDAGRAKVGHEL